MVFSLVILVSLVVLGINWYVCHESGSKIFEEAPEKQYDAILVLGAAVKDGKPTAMLADRIDKAMELYRAGVAPKILMSGDTRSDEFYDEVGVMERYAVERGVPAEDILKDEGGVNTFESMKRAQVEFGLKKIVVVSQKYHLFRAVYVGNALGAEVDGVAADQHIYTEAVKREVREILARNKDFWQSLLQKVPDEIEILD